MALMSTNARPQDELSMEEILASIRKIISDDNEAETDQPQDAIEQPAEQAVVAQKDDDVLELTEMVGARPGIEPVREPAPIQPEAYEPHVPDELAHADVTEAAPIEEDVSEMAKNQMNVAEAVEEETLISEPSADAAVAALSQLAAAEIRTEEVAAGIALGGANKTLEDIVKDMMRPMLRDWLDQNLPGLVQKVVQREVRRLVERVQDE